MKLEGNLELKNVKNLLIGHFRV